MVGNSPEPARICRQNQKDDDEMMTPLNHQLSKLHEFPVEKLGEKALLKRVDTKFLAPASRLPALIELLSDGYGLLPAGGEAIADYRTLYFDSPERRLYHQHRRGRRDRFKIRIRHYLDRSLTMLEVKCKNNHGITSKNRLDHDFGDHRLSGEDRVYLTEHSPGDGQEYEPQIWTNFRRITLVGLHSAERLTIDLNLEFSSRTAHQKMPGLAIIEMKQPHFHPRSEAIMALRAQGLRKDSMSKYCTAQAMLNPELRQNRFLPVLKRAERLSHV